jgi:hypothetical protein
MTWPVLPGTLSALHERQHVEAIIGKPGSGLRKRRTSLVLPNATTSLVRLPRFFNT